MTTQTSTINVDNAARFMQNYASWRAESRFRSADNYDNPHFREIVAMGQEAVPFIYREIKEKPSKLVHALNLIFPGVMTYDGFVSIQDACDEWITTLEQTGIAL